ncbi:regulator of telomere elongation helicase 1 rtel1, putative [Perkinsus marinus ATCC 50983]|uniref:Regulator of telomere elongation helicase 1 rtel1, putative n=1 Tax=Perkinsus marinus (strain ATCC 50983 / TXsc) TaxID=423536 RepID=C5LH62_PERM5|nr:regulator of telomere elongation helicase 1 rtel1, putative [Perkinsus marinus ATCC 50983]EER03871.1 regulator of telomere elongation helicase 1 rtel1, putative [Perkinsus marinus ATCC 50983]|eukprot:XP_002772055.1 regulator of telomere elongation helicase 1 rtel1, putative [Perkinsus marinus ATCC 50983]
MTKVIETLQAAYSDPPKTGSPAVHNALLESPTGTGKTLCLLCATLAWRRSLTEDKIPSSSSSANAASLPIEDVPLETQPEIAHAVEFGIIGPRWRSKQLIVEEHQRQSRRSPSPPSRKSPVAVPKIVYSSRTHSQLRQVMRELRSTSYAKDCQHITLASREHYCVNTRISAIQGSRKTAACTSLILKNACPYYNRMWQMNETPSMIPPPALDVEELTSHARGKGYCPFYYARKVAREGSNLGCMLVPYNYLFDLSALKGALGPQALEGAIVIVDEGHNIEAVCEESASFEWGNFDIFAAVEEVDEAAYRCNNSPKILGLNVEHAPDDSPSAAPVTEDDLLLLKEDLMSLEATLTSADIVTATEGSAVLDFFKQAGITDQTVTRIRSTLEGAISLFHTTAPEADAGGHSNNNTLGAASSGAFLGSFLRIIDLVFANDIELLDKASRRTSVLNRNGRFRCFSGGVAARKLLASEGILSLIVTSGTLAPLTEFKRGLRGVDFPIMLENDHIIIWGGIICAGPTNVKLNGSFRARNSHDYLQELGNVLANVAPKAGDGVLVAFSSYAQLRTAKDFWDSHDITNRFQQRGLRIFEEPNDATRLRPVLAEYTAAIASNSCNGAILCAVCRGKVCEGVDLTDRQCRIVMVVGIPYPMFKDERVQLKMQYLDTARDIEDIQKGAHAPLGRAWYSLEAMRAVNQAVGRIIRHKNDFGAVLLCDERFQSEAHRLPAWLRPYVKTYQAFGPAIGSLTQFFNQIPEALQASARLCKDSYLEAAINSSKDASKSSKLVGRVGSTSISNPSNASKHNSRDAYGENLNALTNRMLKQVAGSTGGQNTKTKNDQFVTLLNRTLSKEDSRVITECTKLIVTGGQSLIDDQLRSILRRVYRILWGTGSQSHRELIERFDDMARRVKKNPRVPVLWRQVMEESNASQPAAKRAKFDPTQVQQVPR